MPSIYNTLLQSVAVYWARGCRARARGIAGVAGDLLKSLGISENLFGSSADVRNSGPWRSRGPQDEGPMVHGSEFLNGFCTLPRPPSQTELSI